VAEAFTLYAVIHTPLPLRLPTVKAQPGTVSENLERCLFDLPAAELAFREVIGPAYHRALGELAATAAAGTPLSLSVSGGFLAMSRRWSAELEPAVGGLLREPGVEPVACEPHRGLLFAFDIDRFGHSMGQARDELALLAQRPVAAAQVSGFALNHEIYHTLGRLGFSAVLAESDPRVTDGRGPGHLGRYGDGPVVLHRLQWLSDELRYRLRAGEGEAASMAETIARTPGEVALVSFDFDALAFGPEGAAPLTELTEACVALGVEPIAVGEAAARFSRRAVEYPPPALTVMSDPCIEDLGRDGWAEGLIFGRMQQAYVLSQLIQDAEVRSLADWLLQQVNLSLPRLAGESPQERPPSFWRAQWWARSPSYDEVAREVLAAYDNFVRAAVQLPCLLRHRTDGDARDPIGESEALASTPIRGRDQARARPAPYA